MIFSRKKTSKEEEYMERINPLHNFNLPNLKWGTQKLLRCKKVDYSNNHSPESGDGSRSRSRIDGGIEATREKLMIDFQAEVFKMKESIFQESTVGPAATTAVVGTPPERPWNLRTRRAACKEPRSPTNGDVLMKHDSSPVRNECKYKSDDKREREGEREGERERPKFSVSLSRREIEEDFMEMTGRKLPRKPKKRARTVQKQLDNLFPGLWLSEITADMYKVRDEGETGKR